MSICPIFIPAWLGVSYASALNTLVTTMSYHPNQLVFTVYEKRSHSTAVQGLREGNDI